MNQKNRYELKYIKYLQKCENLSIMIGGTFDEDTDSTTSIDMNDMLEKCNNTYSKNHKLQEQFKKLSPDTYKMINMISITGSDYINGFKNCKEMLYNKDHFKLNFANFISEMKKGILFKKFDKKCLGVFISHEFYKDGTMNALTKAPQLISKMSSNDNVTYLPLKIEGGTLKKSENKLADGTLSLYQPSIDSTLVNVYQVEKRAIIQSQ